MRMKQKARWQYVPLLTTVCGYIAYRLLKNICCTLHIDPSQVVSSEKHMHDQGQYASPSTIQDIVRALRLVSDLDELVWRNTNRHNPQSDLQRNRPLNDIYEEENIRAILDRVRLWERTARSRVGHRPGS